MKKVFLSVSLAAMMFLSSCIGSFSLTNRVLDWNNSLGNKFVNELVFLAANIIPVYEVCVFADYIVLNTIEFWSGSNPMALNEQTIDTENGQFIVKSNGKGYTITNEKGETTQLVQKNGTWYLNDGNQTTKLFNYVDDSHICINLGEEGSPIVELSENGINSFRTTYLK